MDDKLKELIAIDEATTARLTAGEGRRYSSYMRVNTRVAQTPNLGEVT